MVLIKLIRAQNGLIAGISVWVGFSLTSPEGAPQFSFNILVAALTAFLITGAGNIYNDIMDRNIDRINRPERPIPQGRITLRFAAALTIIFLTLGLFLAWYFLPKILLLIVCVNSLLLLAYSIFFKKTAWFGNPAVALLGASCFIFGGFLNSRWQISLVPAGFAFLIHWAREIIKDADDMEGDRICEARTLPIVLGIKLSQGHFNTL